MLLKIQLTRNFLIKMLFYFEVFFTLIIIMNNNFYLFLLFIVLICIFLYIKIKKKNNDIISKNANNYHIDTFINKNDSKLKFTKCKEKKVQNYFEHTFKNHNIVKTKKNDWDLYLPCGYTYVESELKKIIIRDKDQKIFAIQGCDKISSKNYLWKILTDTYGIPNASKMMPMSYIISDKNHIELFKKNYKIGRIYLLKKNIQRKKGILLTKDYNKIMKICNDKSERYKVIQEYVDDLYLIKDRKINLRYYLLIVCHKNIKKGYLYKFGKCIYTNKTHKSKNITENMLNNNAEMFLTSLNLDPKIYDELPESFEDLEEYMGINYYNVLNTNVLNLFKKTMVAIESNICSSTANVKDNLTFQLFGADIIFNNNLQPYLLEFNKGPSMKYITKSDEKMKKQLTADVFRKVKIINDNKDSNFILLK